MKWIGQHIYDQVSRFRNDAYFEKDVYFQGDTVTFTSANADDPAVIIENTTADEQAARLQFKKHRGVDAVDGDNIGEIEFWGYDDGTPSTQLYGKLTTKVHEATSGQESGRMLFMLASHDGGINTGLKLTGGSVDNEIDVEVGRGGASVTDIQGTLSMGGTATINNSGVIQVAAQTVIDHDQLANFAANEHYAQNTITTVGTIGTGVWQGTAIASAYLDADTAHLSGTQTFSGTKTFSDVLVFDGDKGVTPGDGAVIHVGLHSITDTDTSTSGTAAMYTHVNIEAPNLYATNASVTTTDAATLYISGGVRAQTNQTITNNYALWVDTGLVKFDGALTVGGTITGDVTGDLTGQAATVATIAGLAPNTATTQATQGSITSCANLATVGTITTGVWQGTAVASAYMASGTDSAKGALELATTAEAITGTDTARAVTPAGLKARVSQIINLKGYTNDLKDGVYEFANPYSSDDEAPFQHQLDYGSGTINSSTEVAQKQLFRSGGFHVPFACTVATIQTQVTNNNGGNVSVAIVEYRPSDTGGNQNDYPRTVYETVVNASDANHNKVDTVTIATGDLDGTAIPAGSHIMMMIKGDGTSAGASMTVISAAIGLSW